MRDQADTRKFIPETKRAEETEDLQGEYFEGDRRSKTKTIRRGEEKGG